MKDYIAPFLATKRYSKNTIASYTYDLQQFLETCGQEITQGRLSVYEASLQALKPTARQRKRSTVNQFLLYLYDQGVLTDYLRLKKEPSLPSAPKKRVLVDLTDLTKETPYQEGQQIAIWIAYLGLTPSEIAQIQVADVRKDLGILTLEKEGKKRVISLPDPLLEHLVFPKDQVYWFDHGRRPYSRQWLFHRLREFTQSIGHEEWTAQFLREQHILHALDQGVSLEELTNRVGFSSRMRLETYRNGH